MNEVDNNAIFHTLVLKIKLPL